MNRYNNNRRKRKQHEIFCRWTVVIIGFLCMTWLSILWINQNKFHNYLLVINNSSDIMSHSRSSSSGGGMTNNYHYHSTHHENNHIHNSSISNRKDTNTDITTSTRKEDKSNMTTQSNISSSKNNDNNNHSINPKFLVFTPIPKGQGIGNQMHGLLAVHLLGLEFNRIVCVSLDFDIFHFAFESIHPSIIEHCAQIINKNHNEKKNTVSLLNYQHLPINECALKELLASVTKHIIFITANTYPRWPLYDNYGNSIIPENFFFTYYRPRPVLLNNLFHYNTTHNDNKGKKNDDDSNNSSSSTSTNNNSIRNRKNNNRNKKNNGYDREQTSKTTTALESSLLPPKIVVHLRMGDNDNFGDKRDGLDSQSLTELGKMLPRDTLLVTNHVDFYTKMEKKFGWHRAKQQQQQQQVIYHSAIPNMKWGNNPQIQQHNQNNQQQLSIAGNSTTKRAREDNNITDTNNRDDNQRVLLLSHDQKLQLWSDWYTILTAKQVYHTHSDFSLSAIHWMDIWSRTINGIHPKTGKLLLSEESWRRRVYDDDDDNDNYGRLSPPRLVDRTEKELKHCESSLPKENKKKIAWKRKHAK